LATGAEAAAFDGDSVPKRAPRPIKVMGNSAIFVVIGMSSPVHSENLIRV
jgi:hypothetical protein